MKNLVITVETFIVEIAIYNDLAAVQLLKPWHCL